MFFRVRLGSLRCGLRLHVAELDDVAVRILHTALVHEAVILRLAVLGASRGESCLDGGVDVLTRIAGECHDHLRTLPRVDERLVGELLEVAVREHHEKRVLIPHDAGGVLIGEERVDLAS